MYNSTGKKKMQAFFRKILRNFSFRENVALFGENRPLTTKKKPDDR